jgi:hypothetical protein
MGDRRVAVQPPAHLLLMVAAELTGVCGYQARRMFIFELR